ncbi:virulence factor [Jannaschia sp. LMIT008]|uniref:virulence factor n=1 Tax=Jannaschia maritima TaxID=3032585 RepID=UPI002811AEF6|nr:virulence factor [Jannaschia sp. LMIT008]
MPAETANVTVVYWRDIPAQVIVGQGRRAAKVQLGERFEQAIDRAAMRTGAAETDAYLAEWRKVPDGTADGDGTSAAKARAAEIEADWPDHRLRAVALAGGREGDA